MEDLLLAIHFAGLAMGGAAGMGLPVVGFAAEKAPPEHRPSIGAAVKPLQMIGKAGMGLLILTGAIMATAGGVWGEAPVWYWIKLVLVVCLIGGIITADKAGAKARAGDAAAGAKVKMVSKINLTILAAILLCAALAFN